jgi:hypothetical protein
MNMMKKAVALSCLLAGTALSAFAQDNSSTPVNQEITKKNSWLKVGLNAGMPIGDASKISSFNAGLDVSGQFMATRHFGIGIASGYNHYFGKDPVSDFGAVPVNLLLRYYMQPQGFFAGLDGGYSFLTNMTGVDGGFTIKPQLGYHNYDWNFYGYYNHIFSNGPIDIQSVGVAASYNIRFK